MGQAFSAEAFSSANGLAIHLDRPVYYPGDLVNGLVLLNCVRAFDSKALVLKVEGYERIGWDVDTREKHTRNMECKARHDFFKRAIPLQSYGGRVEPGQYQFPFSFVLPPNLPGSFECRGEFKRSSWTETSYRAKIRYKVKAECVVPGILKPNIRTKHYLTLVERMFRTPRSTRLRLRLMKDVYMPTERVDALLDVDNQSFIDFSSVKLMLERKMVLRDPRNSDGAERFTMSECLVQSTYSGVKAGEVQTGGDARVLTLTLPSSLLPMAAGRLVTCDYMLTVVLELHILSFLSPGCPEQSSVLLVDELQPQPDYRIYTGAPPFWQPQYIAQPAVLQLPLAPPIPPDAQTMDKGGHTPTGPSVAQSPDPVLKPSNCPREGGDEEHPLICRGSQQAL